MKSKKKDYLNILAIICARGGSKGVKNKNIKSFCGKPLIAHSIEMARSIKIINKVIVSTDSKKIALTSKKFKAEVPFIRPKKNRIKRRSSGARLAPRVHQNKRAVHDFSLLIF